MTINTRYFFLLTFLLLLPIAKADKIEQFNETFARSVQNKLNAQSIPGGAYVIVHKNIVIDLKSFGYTDKTQRKKVNNETVFRLASVSKTFASTLTTMLAFEQYLSLSDPITKYVPNFNLAKAGDADKITLSHILSQSSGLMPNAFDNLLHENWSMDKIIKQFKRINPICKPNKCYGYQNITYGLLEQVIELSQKETYESLLQNRIFTPLHMKNASLGINVFQQTDTNTAKPHILIQRKKTAKKKSTRTGYLSIHMANGKG
jgi:beta-lactamase class C